MHFRITIADTIYYTHDDLADAQSEALDHARELTRVVGEPVRVTVHRMGHAVRDQLGRDCTPAFWVGSAVGADREQGGLRLVGARFGERRRCRSRPRVAAMKQPARNWRTNFRNGNLSLVAARGRLRRPVRQMAVAALLDPGRAPPPCGARFDRTTSIEPTAKRSADDGPQRVHAGSMRGQVAKARAGPPSNDPACGRPSDEAADRAPHRAPHDRQTAR